MNRLGLFLSDMLLYSERRSAFLEWLLFVSLFFIFDFLLNIFLMNVIGFFNLITLLLVLHFSYFIWLKAVLSKDGDKIQRMLRDGRYDERQFKVFLSRFIPAIFLLSPGVGGMGIGFILVFILARPLGALMTYRAKIDWQSVYEILRLEQERV
ncbi:FxsA family protein [Entomospira entomophila]|uniref:FxsA family protein n=1 Tax=Entomospira entomophila TaxID=2719988 RepID=A0A968KW78_9SPIO|nr:FxsA family protein [Entomospira entomophilus]NIZ40560.1 FxsA family protein [Entomospira entomophilus]WDI36118.1 FxsA family protein [Entomospira entomophilus]